MTNMTSGTCKTDGESQDLPRCADSHMLHHVATFLPAFFAVISHTCHDFQVRKDDLEEHTKRCKGRGQSQDSWQSTLIQAIEHHSLNTTSSVIFFLHDIILYYKIQYTNDYQQLSIDVRLESPYGSWVETMDMGPVGPVKVGANMSPQSLRRA